MRYFVSLIFILSSLFMLPLYAFAQDNSEQSEAQAEPETDYWDNIVVNGGNVPKPRTVQDNFGGWFLGGDVVLGAYHFIDVYRANALTSELVLDEGWWVAGGVMFGFGHLWGSQVFVGPVINATLTNPYVSIDVRVKVAVPFTHQDAVSLFVGYGIGVINDERGSETRMIQTVDKQYDDEYVDKRIKGMFLPIQVAYEHVFNNGFVLGALLETRINFQVDELHYYHLTNEIYNKYEGRLYYHSDGLKRDKVVPFVDTLFMGIHLGYKF